MSLLRTTLRSAHPLTRSTPLTPTLRFASTITVTHSSSNSSGALLGNIEAGWHNLSQGEQFEVYKKLEEIQKRDWKELTVDEKKAAYYIAFGPHGPRAPTNPAGHTMKILVGVGAGVAAAVGVFGLVRSRAPPPPRTLNKEWQEAATEKGREENINPITGLSSEGYLGTGYVQSK